MKRKRSTEGPPSKKQHSAIGVTAEERGAGGPGPSQHHRVATVVKQYCILENNVEVTLTNEAMRVEQWVSAHMAESFGLDVEWKPTFKRGARENPVALLQLSTLQHCLLIQMQRMSTMPEGLRRLLAAPEVALAGVGVREDLRKLVRDYGLECDGAVELAVLAGEVLGRPELRQAGLRALSLAVLRKEWVKNKRVTMSNWEQDLDHKQVTYAATDAWVSHAVHQALRKHRGGLGKGAAQANGAGGGSMGRQVAGAVLAETSAARAEDGALESEFAREVERRQIDVNPHGAFLEERRRLSGQDRSPRGRGVGAGEGDLRDKLQQNRQEEAVDDLRDVLTERKRARMSAEAGPIDHLQQGLGPLPDVSLEGRSSTGREALDEGGTMRVAEEVRVVEGGLVGVKVRVTATRNGRQLTEAQLARRKKKERHRKYGGKKTASAS